jgi:hypothetical protein
MTVEMILGYAILNIVQYSKILVPEAAETVTAIYAV